MYVGKVIGVMAGEKERWEIKKKILKGMVKGEHWEKRERGKRGM